MKLTPLFDRVVLKSVEVEETTKSGLILASNSKEKPSYAEVVAVGPGTIIEGKKVEMVVKPGDLVVINKFTGSEVKIDDVTYTVVSQPDILAIVEK